MDVGFSQCHSWKTVLSLLNSTGIFVENHLTVYVIILFCCSCLIESICMSLYQIHTVLSLVVSLQFLLQNCFGYSSLLRFHMNFKTDFSISIKSRIRIPRKCITTIELLGYNYILTMLRLPIHENVMSFNLLFFFFNFFH